MPNKKTLNELLDQIFVLDPGIWENEHSESTISEWYAVATDEHGGIIAYFQFEADAYRFRLDRINQTLNPIAEETHG